MFKINVLKLKRRISEHFTESRNFDKISWDKCCGFCPFYNKPLWNNLIDDLTDIPELANAEIILHEYIAPTQSSIVKMSSFAAFVDYCHVTQLCAHECSCTRPAARVTSRWRDTRDEADLGTHQDSRSVQTFVNCDPVSLFEERKSSNIAVFVEH